MIELEMRRNEMGAWLWPKLDVGAWAAVFATLPDLQLAIDACKTKKVAIQAGGNCGAWPLYLAKQFETVYTFEPDHANFACLAYNCLDPNVVKMQACLGDCANPPRALQEYSPDNSGAHYVSDADGIIPELVLDDLCLPWVDLIALDVEGMEGPALRGATSLITQCMPVVMFEDKHSERYGWKKGEVEEFLADHWGYKVLARPHRDVIMAPPPGSHA